MLNITDEKLEFYGNSIINDIKIMEMNANADSNQVTFNQDILDFEAYTANMDAVDADYAEFKKYVVGRISFAKKK